MKHEYFLMYNYQGEKGQQSSSQIINTTKRINPNNLDMVNLNIGTRLNLKGFEIKYYAEV